MASVKELLEQVKAATGPDRELDYAISRFADGELARHSSLHLPYTSSIDAALALTERLLPGWEWQVRKTGYVELHHPTHHLKDEIGCAATPPLAIILATLSALSTKEGE